jgi:hypothetical protein
MVAKLLRAKRVYMLFIKLLFERRHRSESALTGGEQSYTLRLCNPVTQIADPRDGKQTVTVWSSETSYYTAIAGIPQHAVLVIIIGGHR